MSTATAIEEEKRFFVNPQGFQIPKDEMAAQDILKDELVTAHIAKAKELSLAHDAFKRKVFSDIQDFIGLLGDNYDIDVNTSKGNLTVTSFDSKNKIMIGIDDQIEFGAEIDIAKQLINEVMESELKESSHFLREIVLDAFQVNTQGSYSKVRIMALRKHRLSHNSDKWANAMQALDDGIIAGSSKTYLRFYDRNIYGKWIQIPMVSTSL